MLNLSLQQYSFQPTTKDPEQVKILLEELSLNDIATYDSSFGIIEYSIDCTKYISLADLQNNIGNTNYLYSEVMLMLINLIENCYEKQLYHGDLSAENILLLLDNPIDSYSQIYINQIKLIQHRILEDDHSIVFALFNYFYQELDYWKNVDIASIKYHAWSGTYDENFNKIASLEGLRNYTLQMKSQCRQQGIVFKQIYSPKMTKRVLEKIREYDFGQFVGDKIGIILRNNVLSLLTKELYFQQDLFHEISFQYLLDNFFFKGRFEKLFSLARENKDQKQNEELLIILKQNKVFNDLRSMETVKSELFTQLLKSYIDENHPLMIFQKTRQVLFKRTDWYQKYDQICLTLTIVEKYFSLCFQNICKIIKQEISAVYKDDNYAINYEKYLSQFDEYLSKKFFSRNQLLKVPNYEIEVRDFIITNVKNEILEEIFNYYSKINQGIVEKLKYE